MTQLNYEPTHTIKLEDGTVIKLAVISDEEFAVNQSIVVYESATGNGGVTYSNGRLQEDLPVNGTLIGDDLVDINNIKGDLSSVADSGQQIEYTSPYQFDRTRGNKYFIKSLKFLANPGVDRYLSFSMVLTESRESNVETIQVNLVNFASAELYRTQYELLTQGQ